MSDTPMELARDIVNLIMESESYLRYKSALEQIISTPEQLEKLKEVITSMKSWYKWYSEMK